MIHPCSFDGTKLVAATNTVRCCAGAHQGWWPSAWQRPGMVHEGKAAPLPSTPFWDAKAPAFREITVRTDLA